jgi:hypothetical protein
MVKLLNKVKYFGLAGMFLVPTLSFGLNKVDPSQSEQSTVSGVGGGIADGANKGLNYLKYAVWAAAVMGILAVAFMLFGNVQETIMKTVVRVIAVVGVVAMAFVIPSWFSLSIPHVIAILP